MANDNVRYLRKQGDLMLTHFTDNATKIFYAAGPDLWTPRTGGPAPDPDPDPDPTPGDWTHPAPGTVLTSPFGPRDIGYHYGIDLSSTTAAVGVPILAVCDTIITQAWDAYEGGNDTAGTYVKGHSTDGLFTFTYNHGADGTLAVAAGQTVPKGTQLFLEGGTGNVTGTHLHFEIIEGNWPDPWAPPYNNGANFVDPIPVLTAHGVNI